MIFFSNFRRKVGEIEVIAAFVSASFITLALQSVTTMEQIGSNDHVASTDPQERTVDQPADVDDPDDLAATAEKTQVYDQLSAASSPGNIAALR